MRTAFLAVVLVGCANHSSPPAAGTPDAARAPDGAIITTGDAASADATVTADAGADAFVDRGIEQDDDDLATTLAGIARTAQLAAMVDTTVIAYGGAPTGLTLVQPGDFAGTRDGVSYSYTFECEDTTGTHVPTCDSTMDHVHMLATADGAVMIDTLAMPEVKQTEHWIEREINLDKPRIEGTGRQLVSAHLATTGTAFKLTVDGTYTHVRFDPMPTLPLSGTVAYAISAQRTRATATPTDRTFTAMANLTFAAGGQATISLDGTHNYTVDMASGAVTRQ